MDVTAFYRPNGRPTGLSLVGITAAIATLVLLTTAAAIAQTPPPLEFVPPSREPLPEGEPLPPLEDLLRLPTAPDPDLPRPQDIPGEIVVEQFLVLGSTVFSSADFTTLLAPYTGRPLSFASLLEVQTVITDFYRQQGYITSGAFIPPQTLTEGVVQVQVVEGEVEEIEISGLQRLGAGYVRSRLGLGAQPPLNQNRLLQALQLLQLDPLIANLAVELAAGTRPGRSLLLVQIEEAPAVSASLTLDNQRSPSVGSVRRLARFSHQNLLGLGDQFSVGYISTEGSNALDNLSYTLPLNPRNGTLTLSHSRSQSQIIERPFDILDITAIAPSYQLTYRQPVWQTPTTELALGLTASWQQSQTFLGLDNIGGFPFAPGADLEGRTTATALRLVQEYSQRSDRDVLALRSQFSLGLEALGATRNPQPPDSRFFSWRGQAQYLRLLAPETLLLLRLEGQLADRPLLPFEQFALGGVGTVRGYRQDVLLADSGMLASAEVRLPVLQVPAWQAVLQVAPFFDFGTVWNRSQLELATPTISSLGLGLRFRAWERLTGRLDWGWPLVDLGSSRRTLQESGFYFSVNYDLF